MKSVNHSNQCPLCGSCNAAHFHQDKRRDYFRCVECFLVFVPKHQHLSAELEKSEYDKHENQLNDPGYLSFLSRLAIPLLTELGYQALGIAFNNSAASSADIIELSRLSSNDSLKQASIKTTENAPKFKSIIKPEELELKGIELEGLDFGCGPGPALAHELERLGFFMNLYDLYYQPDTTPLNRQYDFVTCTEVIEHFNHPAKPVEQLFSLVKESGVLAIMTKLVIDQERFKSWHYKNDLTHVSFFSQQTFLWLADKYNCDVTFVDKDVIFFTSK